MNLLNDDIKLSVQETGESTVCLGFTEPIQDTFEDAFVDCPEETSESIYLHVDRLPRIQTILIRLFSNDHREETSESIRSCDGGLQTFQTKFRSLIDLREETSESIRSRDGGLQTFQTELLRSSFGMIQNACSVSSPVNMEPSSSSFHRSGLYLLKEASEAIRSRAGGLRTFQTEPFTSSFDPCEEPSEFIRSRDGGLQTFQTKFRSLTGKIQNACSVSCPVDMVSSSSSFHRSDLQKGTSESIRSRDGGLQTSQTEPFRSSFGIFLAHKLTKSLKDCTSFNLSCHSRYGKDHVKEPTSHPLLIPSYGYTDGAIQTSNPSFINLQLSKGFSTLFMFKFLFTSLLQVAVSETQSLRYYHSGVFYPDEWSFTFHAVGFVNNHQIDKYDHITKHNVPVASWMEKHEDNSYWDRETNYRRGWEKVFSDNLRILKYRLNGSSVFLTLQLMYGCDLGTDGSVRGYYQYALNGRDFLYLDERSMLWQPVVNEAEISAKRWNTDPNIAKSVKGYLTQHCTSALNRYIVIGEEELNKTVRPEVKVWSRHQSDDVLRLQCLVYGFHPRSVHVKWVMNGVDDVPADEMSPILPHPDGTYQIRVSAEVPIREGDTFSCHVDHSSLEETLIVKWEVNNYNFVVRATLLSASLIPVLIFIIILARRTSRKVILGV